MIVMTHSGLTKPKPPTIRVFIVDDHPFIRKGIRAFIEQEPDILVIGESGSGLEALKLCRQDPPDVLLLDLSLPDMPGIQILKELQHQSLRIRTVVCSSYSDDDNILAAIQAGATGYLIKTDPPEKILQALRNAYHGISTLSDFVESRVTEMDQPGNSPPLALHHLTTRELQILRLLATGHTNHEIAEKCFISEGTVRTHIFHMQEKLSIDSRAKLVIYSIKQGIAQI